MKKSPLSEAEIASFIGRKIHTCLNDSDGDISDIRVENYNFYMGKPYGNERDGHSSIVTREALETVEWALPSVLRVFTSGDRVVSYDPVGPEDEDQAEQETDIANYHIQKSNNGFVAIHNWCKDCLMYPNGYIGLWIDETKKTQVEEYEGLSAFGLQEVLTTLAMKGDIEVLEQNAETKTGADGVPYECYDVKIRVTWTDKKPILESIPGDELLVDGDLTSIDLDNADFVCRRLKKPFTKLVNEGYDPEKLSQIGSYVDYDFLDEKESRLFYDDEDDHDTDDDDSMRGFWVHDCYLYIDTDGDGLAEFRHITMIGAEIFIDEEVSYQPYIAMAAILTPHRHAGLSYVDVVKDLQEIKSALWRQMLDNIYKLNQRRKYVGDAFISDEGGTLDVLFDNTAEFIPARDPNAIREEMVQPMVSDILPVIQGVTDLQNVRTGVSPQLSLDPSVLQQSTMGAFRSALDEASQRIEMLVRVFAETGFKKLFQKMHHLLRTNVDRELAIKLRGQWVEVAPSSWMERTDITVSTGLGFNNKDQKIGLLTQLLALQKEALPTGMADMSNVYNTLEDLVECAGLGNIERRFKDPKAPGFQPPPPQENPLVQVEMAKIQAQGQIKQMEAQEKAQERQVQQQKDMVEMRLRMNEEQRKNQELMMRMQELERKLANMDASTYKTYADAANTQAETEAQGVETEAVKSGLIDLVESLGQDSEPQ